MKILEPGEREQAFIDQVVNEARRRSWHINQMQRERLIELAQQYSHLGDIAVKVVLQTLITSQEMSERTTATMKANLERRLLPEKPDQDDDVDVIIIEGEKTRKSRNKNDKEALEDGR